MSMENRTRRCNVYDELWASDLIGHFCRKNLIGNLDLRIRRTV